MKAALYTLTIILITTSARGQNVFPTYSDSANWHVLRTMCGWGCWSITDTFQYETDTLMCGDMYSKLSFHSNVAYIRNDSLKTYCRLIPSCSAREYLLYDYSMQVGDSTYLGYNLWYPMNVDTVLCKLNAVDTMVFNGVSRRVHHMLYADPIYYPTTTIIPIDWIKGIGSTTHPFYSLDCVQQGCETFYNLLCYDSMFVNLYKDSILNTCDTSFTASINDIENINSLTVYPNPFTNQFYFEIKNDLILNAELLKIDGRVVKSVNNIYKASFSFDELDLLPGIYLLKAEKIDGRMVSKLVLKHY